MAIVRFTQADTMPHTLNDQAQLSKQAPDKRPLDGTVSEWPGQTLKLSNVWGCQLEEN